MPVSTVVKPAENTRHKEEAFLLFRKVTDSPEGNKKVKKVIQKNPSSPQESIAKQK